MIPSMESQKVGPDFSDWTTRIGQNLIVLGEISTNRGQSELKGNCYKPKHIVGGQHLLHQRKREKRVKCFSHSSNEKCLLNVTKNIKNLDIYQIQIYIKTWKSFSFKNEVFILLPSWSKWEKQYVISDIKYHFGS